MKPPSFPPAAITRWHGTMTGMGLAPHAPPTARDVLALDSSHDAEHFRVKNSRGDERVLGCELLSWTE